MISLPAVWWSDHQTFIPDRDLGGPFMVMACATSYKEDKRAQNELATISREIAWYEEQARRSVCLALQYKLEIGKRLALARRLLPHGQFLRWAQSEFGWTPRHVQNHLTLAANEKRVSHLPAGASLRMALAAIKESQLVDAKERVEVLPPPRQIHIIGEVEEDVTLDCERLLTEISRLATELGAPNTRWKMR